MKKIEYLEKIYIPDAGMTVDEAVENLKTFSRIVGVSIEDIANPKEHKKRKKNEVGVDEK